MGALARSARLDLLPLLGRDGVVASTALRAPLALERPVAPLRSRVAYAAAHVVPRSHAENVPGEPAAIDWDATLAFRRHLYGWGLGVADAMDTAQRNMGLDPAAIRELVARSAAVAAECGGRLVVGVNTDDLEQRAASSDEIVDAYVRQLRFAEEHGATAVVMASRHLAAAADDAAAYLAVYDRLLEAAEAPVILHWLGAAFDPALRDYFGHGDWRVGADTLIEIVERHADTVAGVKMSLLDAEAEVAVRARLAVASPGARMFAGDDFHYVDLIAGDDPGGAPAMASEAPRHSDALLGAFAAIAPLASAAIQALDRQDPEAYRALLEPTEALSRHVFASPTYHYKTGIAFLAWLGGHQRSPQMVGGLHAARSLPHLSRIVELANEAGALEAPDLALERWTSLLRLHGIEA